MLATFPNQSNCILIKAEIIKLKMACSMVLWFQVHLYNPQISTVDCSLGPVLDAESIRVITEMCLVGK